MTIPILNLIHMPNTEKQKADTQKQQQKIKHTIRQRTYEVKI